MHLWRRNYPRVRYQPVVCIHGIYYAVKDEIVFKRHNLEWVLPSCLQRHIKYNPRHLPVIIKEEVCTPSDNYLSSVVSASQALLRLSLWSG